MMMTMGIKKSQTVVIYESGKGWFATRAAMVLKVFGHPEVYVLDGGLAKWTSEGRKVESDKVDTWEADFDYTLDSEQIFTYERVK